MSTNPFEGMTEQQLADLRKYAEWEANRKLSTGGTNTGSQWGVGSNGGFVWYGAGEAPNMTKDQILADMGFMSTQGGWNPDGGGPKPPGSPTAPAVDPNAKLKAYLAYLAGQAGNANPVALPQGTAVTQNTSTQYATPSYPGIDRPQYGTPGKKGGLL